MKILRTATDRAADPIRRVTDRLLEGHDVLDRLVIRRAGGTERRRIAIQKISFSLKREKSCSFRPQPLLKKQKIYI